MASQVVLVIKHLTTNAGDIRDRTHRFDPWVKEILWRMARHETEHMGLIHGSRRCPGGWHGNPFQYSCLENPHGQMSLEDYSP